MRYRNHGNWNNTGGYVTCDTPITPSTYDLLLTSLGIRYEEAVKVVKNGDPRGAPLREWIKQQKRSKFVPIEVLEAMGFQEWGG